MFVTKLLVISVILVSVRCISEKYYQYYHKSNINDTNNSVNMRVSFKSDIWHGISNVPRRKKSHQTNTNITLRSPIATNATRVPSVLRRKSKIDVNPVLQNCKSQEFKNGLKTLQSKVRCKPRQSIVYLESSSKTTLIPNAVPVKRCEGSCSASHKCIPTRISNTTYFVREIKLNTVYCTSVVVLEHEACKCDCPMKATDCNFNQEYDTETCRCNCKNEQDFSRCLQRRNIKWYWNEEECACMCVEFKSCTTGTVWNPNQCKCVLD